MRPLCIHPKQIAWILGVSVRQAQRTLKAIRKELNKKKHHAITVKEFSDYKGFDEADVLVELRKIH